RVVIKADVAAGYGNGKRAAGFGHAVYSFAELPHDFGFFGIAKIEAIRGGPRTSARGGHIAGGFGNGMHGAGARIERAPTAFAVGGKREGTAGALETNDRGIGGAGEDEGVGANHVVVLFEDPALGGDRGSGQETAEIGGKVRASRGKRDLSFTRGRRLGRRDVALVDGRLLGERVGGNFRRDLAVMQDAQHAVRSDA